MCFLPFTTYTPGSRSERGGIVAVQRGRADAVKTSAFVCTQQGAMPKVPAEYLA